MNNLREGDLVQFNSTGITAFSGGMVGGEVINVGRDGMVILALGINKEDVRPIFIIHPSKLSKICLPQ
jgi:hypothetical protein